MAHGFISLQRAGADCPYNLRQMAARLEVRKKFLLQPGHRQLEPVTNPCEERENSEQFQVWLQKLHSRTGTSHLKENENGDVTEMWRGQLCTDTSIGSTVGA
jgi:hypothetical protein